MYIEEIIGDKGALLESAMRHPALLPKRKPTIEAAMKCVISEVERTCMTLVAKDYEDKLNDVYLNYTLMNGDRDEIDVASVGDWDEGLDNEVEKLFEPITEHLSQSWLGEKTIDTRLQDDGEITKLASSVGKEIFKQLTFGKEPGQVLSNAGIFKTDVEAFFEAHMQPQTPEQEKATMADQEQNVATIAATIAAHVGVDHDQLAVYEDVEMLFEDDEILADAAASRLGINEFDVQTLQMAALDSLDVDSLYALIANAPAEGASKAPAVKPTSESGKPRVTKKAEREAAKAAQAGNTMSPDVLQFYKAHGGTGDTELAAKLGVSRGTFNNYLSGKSPFAPDDGQRETLRAQVVGDINGLLGALALIDGAEYEVYS